MNAVRKNSHGNAGVSLEIETARVSSPHQGPTLSLKPFSQCLIGVEGGRSYARGSSVNTRKGIFPDDYILSLVPKNLLKYFQIFFLSCWKEIKKVLESLCLHYSGKSILFYYIQ